MNNRTTRKRCKICSNFHIKTLALLLKTFNMYWIASRAKSIGKSVANFHFLFANGIKNSLGIPKRRLNKMEKEFSFTDNSAGMYDSVFMLLTK